MIYLDNAATTRIYPEVRDAMLPYLGDEYGNPGSTHILGRNAAYAIEKARELVAKPIGAKPDSIMFTSCGSESNTMVFAGLAQILKEMNKTHIVTTQVEHHSVLNAAKYMECLGFTVTYLPVESDGSLPMSTVKCALRPNTGLVSVMCVNNETGNIYNIAEIGRLAQEAGAFFHTDCVQAYGCVDLDVDRDNIDFMSVSGHKFHAPKGVGFLYIRKRYKGVMDPLIYGGEQEYGKRGGTENVASIVGMGEAARLAYENRFSIWEYVERVKSTFLTPITTKLSSTVHVNGLPGMGARSINLRIDGVNAETLLLMLENNGVLVSAGSACSAHQATASHVLKALGLSDEEAMSSIRVSFSDDVSQTEALEAADIIMDCVEQLRAI